MGKRAEMIPVQKFKHFKKERSYCFSRTDSIEDIFPELYQLVGNCKIGSGVGLAFEVIGGVRTAKLLLLEEQFNSHLFAWEIE